MSPSPRRTLWLAVLSACLLPGVALAAGDVKGKVKGGDLILKGDSADNRIEITGYWGTVTVRGLGGTRINGKKEVVFDDVDRDLNIKLKEGDDSVTIQDIVVYDDLRIETGKGRDHVIVQGVDVVDDFHLTTGKERDDVELDEVWVLGQTDLNFGDAADDVVLFDVVTEDDIQVEGGDGADEIEVLYCWFYDDVVIDEGDGDDDLFVGSGTIFWDDVELDGGDDIDYLILGTVSFSFFKDVDFDDFEFLSF